MPVLSLHTNNLLQLSDDLNEVLLSTHDLVDVLVSSGDLIDHTRVLTTLDAGRLRQLYSLRCFFFAGFFFATLRLCGNLVRRNEIAREQQDGSRKVAKSQRRNPQRRKGQSSIWC
jgi:hypothetical protein